MSCLKRLCLIASILIAAIVGQGGAMAGYDGPRSRAIIDGIGYRANVLDPYNKYDVSARRMMGVLLHRFAMLPTSAIKRWGYAVYRNADEGVSERDPGGYRYVVIVRRMINDPFIQQEITKPYEHYFGYGACTTNNIPTALLFMEAVSQSALNAQTKDNLILVRHLLLGLCGEQDKKREKIITRVNHHLEALQVVGDARPWAFYLKALIAFYTEQFDAASELFAKVSVSPSKWLTDTARYMDVRIAKIQSPLPNASKDLSNDMAVVRFKNALHSHVTRYPDSLYAESVANLDKYLYRVLGDNEKLTSVVFSRFKEAFAADSSVSEAKRVLIFNEVMTYYFNDDGYSSRSSDHPLFIAFELLMRSKILKAELPVRPLPTIQLAVADARNDFSRYPGLLAFVSLLMEAAVGNDSNVIGTAVSETRFGPLWPDAEYLRARALNRLGRHREAADVWLDLAHRFPVHNAWTEIATSYVHLGRFDEFARLAPQAREMRNRRSENRGLAERGYYDVDMDLTAIEFHHTYDPYPNLLRRGFVSFADEETARRVYTDANINGFVRFVAAEPVMRRYLLEEQYSKFRAVAAKLIDGNAEFDGSDISDLARAYLKMIPVAETLAKDRADPEALVDMGYFLYSNHLFYNCGFEDATLWEQSLGACNDNGSLFKRLINLVIGREATRPAGVAPIDLFQRALNRFKQRPARSPKEAKVLRIMIYCFNGQQNIDNCVRNQFEAYPKTVRRSWFRRLHREFPEETKKVKYWY